MGTDRGKSTGTGAGAGKSACTDAEMLEQALNQSYKNADTDFGWGTVDTRRTQRSPSQSPLATSATPAVVDRQHDDWADGIREQEEEQEKRAARKDGKDKNKKGDSIEVLLSARRVSRAQKCFSSMRVRVLVLIVLLFAATMMSFWGFFTEHFGSVYKEADRLEMSELVQRVARSALSAPALLAAHGMVIANDPTLLGALQQGSSARVQQWLDASLMGDASRGVDELPAHLAVVWDAHWTLMGEVYYPCRPNSSGTPEQQHGACTLSATAANSELPAYFTGGEFAQACASGGKQCAGLVTLAAGGGASFVFAVASLGTAGHMLLAADAHLLARLEAERSGMCISLYSSFEPALPESIAREAAMLNISSNSSSWNARNAKYKLYLRRKYKPSEREQCPADEVRGRLVSKTVAYARVAVADPTGTLGADAALLVRFDYPNPRYMGLTGFLWVMAGAFIVMLVLIYAFMYALFECMFLRPIARLRDSRAALIKKTLAALEDNGVVSKELFTAVVDDQALLDAKGDVITVVRTLQERTDAIYARIIDSRRDELVCARALNHNALAALRLMNLFLRRDDDALHALLPGLLAADEVARRFRRTTIISRARKGELFYEILAAQRRFRTLKAVLSNTTATQFFKAFCLQCGRSTLNSLFFLMDVSWLHEVETTASAADSDFLAAMLADPASPLASPRASPPATAAPAATPPAADEGALLCSPRSGTLDRPHFSHFASSSPPTLPASPPADADTTASAATSGGGGGGDADGGDKRQRPPRLQLPLPQSPLTTPADPPLVSPRARLLSPRGSPVPAARFGTRLGEAIARFVHESYFGRGSLAQRDRRHAALVGCSQVADYLRLRDNANVVYRADMYNALVAAVTKKLTADVLPLFLRSVAFQVLVFVLALSTSTDPAAPPAATVPGADPDAPAPALQRDTVLRTLWPLCHETAAKDLNEDDDEEEDEEDEHTSSSSSSSTSSSSSSSSTSSTSSRSTRRSHVSRRSHRSVLHRSHK